MSKRSWIFPRVRDCGCRCHTNPPSNNPALYAPGTEHWLTESNINEIAAAVEGWSTFKAHGKDVLWPNESGEWPGIGYGIGCKIKIPTPR